MDGVIFIVNNLIYILVVFCYNKYVDVVLIVVVKGEDEFVLYIWMFVCE